MTLEKPDDAMFVVGVDHRFDVIGGLLGVRGRQPTAAELEQAADLIGVVFAGLAAAVEDGMPKSQAAIWAEPVIGEAVLLRARAMSLASVVAVEKPRVAEFQIDNVLGFKDTLKRLAASYAGARVAYNPVNNPAVNESQRHMLRRLSQICRDEGPRLVLELFVPPTELDVQTPGAGLARDRDMRAMLTVQAIRELQDAGVEPSVWAIEQPLDKTTARAIAAQAHVDDRSSTGVLFTLGGDSEASDEETVRLAARAAGVNGLLIGPAAYRRELRRYHAGEIDRREAIAAISASLQRLREIFARASRTSQVS